MRPRGRRRALRPKSTPAARPGPDSSEDDGMTSDVDEFVRRPPMIGRPPNIGRSRRTDGLPLVAEAAEVVDSRPSPLPGAISAGNSSDHAEQDLHAERLESRRSPSLEEVFREQVVSTPEVAGGQDHVVSRVSFVRGEHEQ